MLGVLVVLCSFNLSSRRSTHVTTGPATVCTAHETSTPVAVVPLTIAIALNTGSTGSTGSFFKGMIQGYEGPVCRDYDPVFTTYLECVNDTRILCVVSRVFSLGPDQPIAYKVLRLVTCQLTWLERVGWNGWARPVSLNTVDMLGFQITYPNRLAKPFRFECLHHPPCHVQR